MSLRFASGLFTRRLLAGILLVLCISGLYAEVYLPQWTLQGYHPIVENRIDVYKYYRGLHFTSGSSWWLEDFNVVTVVKPDYANGGVFLTPQVGSRSIGPTLFMTFDDYLQGSTAAKFHQLLRKNVYETLQDEERDSGTGIFREFEIELPRMAIPKPFRRVLGNTAKLSIDGSQKLTFAGSSTVTKGAAASESGQAHSFSLEMKQELRLRLRGTIGDKIHVNVSHTSISEETISNPNVLEISYEGTEDEIVQEIQAGNISLSLPGTTYIGYSASSESLFGVKSRMKIGNLELTTIIGKEEGQKSSKHLTGSSESDSVTIYSKGYAPRTYYYVADPYELYWLYDGSESDCYNGWANNAIRTTDSGAWYIARSDLLPTSGTVHLYFDDNNYSNDEINTVVGHAIGDDTEYSFEELLEGTDFVVDYDLGIVAIDRTINREYTIGIVYTTLGGDQIGNLDESDLTVKLLRKKNQSIQDDTWQYQMRNIYHLSSLENVKNEGFNFGVYTVNEDNSMNISVPDNLGTGDMKYIDYLRLDSNHDGLINGDDETINLTSGTILFPYLEPFYALGDSIIYKNDSESINVSDTELRMYAVGSIGREQISLNQLNVIKGSVKIKVEGRTLTENVDYIVDYDFGTITFLTSEGKDPDADISIDFEYKPIFAIESKSMFGIRAEMKFSDDARLGSTFIYHSEKVEDEHPKIGHENKTQMMADIDGQVTVNPPFMTKLVDLIPLVRTDEESEVTIAGEVAVNLPFIYGDPDKKDDPEAYLEDMESILSTYPLGVTRKGWVQSSAPYSTRFSRAEINWWNPTDVYAQEVYEDSLLTEDERDEKVTLLRCKIMPTGLHMPGVNNRSWGGLMKYIGNQVDFSEKKYIEVMARVDTLNTTSSILMHIDMGDINEDFYTEMGGLGVLNLEDGKNGGSKDGVYDYMEDVGLDGVPDGEAGDDPNDDYSNDKVSGEYPHINATEGNKELDTEDLDSNGTLDMVDRYYEYTLDLTGLQYLESANSKGFRIYRIPLTDETAYRKLTDTSKEPVLTEISYVRFWLEVTDTTYVDIVNLDVVGNKWEAQPIRYVYDFLNDPDVSQTVLENNNESMQSGITDNIENSHYTAPPSTTDTEDGVETLEQSLVVDYTNLHPEHYGIVRQQFRDSYSLLNYGKLRFYVYPEQMDGETYTDSIEVLVRLGADSLNFYEIAVKLSPYPYDNNPSLGSSKMPRSAWYDFEIDFSDLTILKMLDDDTYSTMADTNGIFTYRKVRNPTLSNIEEMCLGVRIDEESDPFSGRIYFNDIRVADPNNEAGYAARTSITTKFADFMDFSATLTWQTPNFYTISTSSSGSSSTTTSTNREELVSLALNNKYNLHKFFPPDWGLNIPLSLAQTQTEKHPRFKTNSDILVADLDKEDQEQETTKTLNRSASVSISQSRSLGYWWLDYTVKNTTLSGDVSRNTSLTPSAADTTFSYTERLTYNLDIPKEKTGLRLWRDYKMYFVPQSYRNSFSFKASYPQRWNWTKQSSGEYAWVKASQTVDTRTLDITNSITYDMLSDLRVGYQFTTQRNLMWRDYWKGINIGRSKTRSQGFDVRYDPTYFDRFISWNADLTIGYKETQKETKTTDSETGESISTFTFVGDVTRVFNVDVTIKNRDMFNGLLHMLGAGTVDVRGGGGPGPGFNRPPAMNEDDIQQMEDEEEKLDSDHGEPDEMVPDDLFPHEDEPVFNTPEEENRPDDIEPGDMPPPDKMPPPDEKPAEDTQSSGARGPLVFVLQCFARLENINVSYTNTYGTDYEERNTAPDFLYQISLPHQLNEEDISLKDNNDNISASTGLAILDNLYTRWQYSYAITRKYAATTNQTITQVFPNVSVTFSGFENLVKMSDYLTNSSLSSSYVYTKKESGLIHWEEPQSVIKTIAFSPLLGWSGKWPTINLDSNISYTTSVSNNITHNTQSDIIVRNTSQTLNVDLTHRLSASRGIKLPFMKRLILKNEFTTNLGFSYQRVLNTRENGSTKQTDTNTKAFEVDLSGSYNFHRNVEGGSTITYDWTDNLKRDLLIKTFGLSVWVRILF